VKVTKALTLKRSKRSLPNFMLRQRTL